ncbi:hypothetical protein MRX96_016977 [Rhipicephalus microplus]
MCGQVVDDLSDSLLLGTLFSWRRWILMRPTSPKSASEATDVKSRAQDEKKPIGVQGLVNAPFRKRVGASGVIDAQSRLLLTWSRLRLQKERETREA